MVELKTAWGTQALLDLEDRSPDVLFEGVGDSPVPLWPQIRNQFSVALDNLDYNLARVQTRPVALARAGTNLARSIIPSRTDVIFARGRAPLCFVVGGTTVHSVDGERRNWLVADYAEANADRAAVVQWSPGTLHHEPAHFRPTWALDGVVTRAAVRARLSRRDPGPRVSTIVREIARHLDASLRDGQVAAIVTASSYRETLRPFIQKAFERLLDRLDPEIVVMQAASYGAWASIISLMKDRGIVVVEPQHGWIGPSHAAYNFGAAMYSEPLRRTLPDELLTFGDYWGRGLRFPGRITPIGKPHIEAAVASAPMPVADRSEVLVVSSTTDPDEMSRFVLALRSKLDPRWTLVFRPHPAERKALSERYPSLISVEGIRIDTGGDVYESLRSAAVVIGVASTVLFEAIAFGCRVFVRDSPLVDYYVGDRFGPTIKGDSGLAEVAKQINAHHLTQGHATVAGSELWAAGAVERFQAWLKTVPPR